MRRSTFPPVTLTLVALLTGCAGIKAASPVEPLRQGRPNVVLIVADDLGYGEVGFLGQQVIRTPRIDRMAAEGRVLTNFYSGAPTCAPSRGVLMTGMHGGRNAVRFNSQELCLRPGDLVWSQMMKSAGYTNHFQGKWGLGGATPSADYGGTAELIPEHSHSIPSAMGFDTSLAFLEQLTAHKYYPEELWRDGEKWLIPGNHGIPYDDRTVYAHDIFTGEALEILANADGSQPFTLLMSYLIPHRETKSPPGVNPYADEDWPEVEKAFAHMITYFDGEVGQLLDAISANPALAGNTLVILTSDNGPQKTDGHDPEFFNSRGPLRGIKRDLYEGGIRVPFIAWWPGTITPSTTSDHPADYADIFPTLAELAGARIPPGLDGVSILPTLLDRGGQAQRPFHYWEHHETLTGVHPVPSRRAVRQGDWKAITFADGTHELYDLGTDIGETTDLKAAHPDVAATLLEIIQREDTGPPALAIARPTIAGNLVPIGQDVHRALLPTPVYGRSQSYTFTLTHGASGPSPMMTATIEVPEGIGASVGELNWIYTGSTTQPVTITIPHGSPAGEVVIRLATDPEGLPITTSTIRIRHAANNAEPRGVNGVILDAR
jgi:arylsulfatase A